MTAEVDLPPAAEARLRAGLDAAATTAPVAPAWDAIHERVEAGDVVALRPPRRRSPALVAAAAAVLLLALAGIAVAVTRPDDGAVTAAGTEAYCAVLSHPARTRIEVVVYLAPDVVDRAGVEEAIAATGLAGDVRFVDRDASFAEAQRLFADQPTMRDVIRPEDVPTSFRLTVADADAADRLSAAVEMRPDVLDVVDARGWRVDVLQVLSEVAEGDEGSLPLAAPQRVDGPVVDALVDATPADLADAVATVVPALRSRSDVDETSRRATASLVEDAAGRCDLRPDALPEPPTTVALGPDASTATTGATTTTAPG